MAHDIFISYSTKDKPTADAACATLEAAGIRCWIAPRDILPGMEWGDAIIRAINNCRAMVLVFSSNANESLQIRREVERAVSKGVPVIPLRIEDIAPTHSLEYFIGTVHWLDALTPPLENHLQRLSENVAALLNTGINPHKIPESIAAGPIPAAAAPRASAAPQRPSQGAGIPPWAIMVAVAVVVVGGLLWWHSEHAANSSVADTSFNGGAGAPPPAADQPPPSSSPGQAAPVDPGVVGTLEYSSVIDDYDWHFTNTIDADGTYRLVMLQQESGTYQASNGQFQTIGAKTQRVRQGTYVALSADTLQVTGANGTVVYRLQQPSAQGATAGHSVLGSWQSNVVVNGQPWVLTLQTHTDGTYDYTARADDHGTCRIANGTWQSTSAVTGQTNPGTYQVLNAHQVQLSSAAGTSVWQRK